MSKSKVLILCTSNSCRSQMAQGMIRHYLGKKWKAFSAGTRPSGEVHPLAIKVMAEIDIDISGYKSKSIEKYRKKKFDEVITVCDHASEDCPTWLDKGKVTHIDFPDPAEATGGEKERLAVFRSVRDDMYRRIPYYLTNHRVLIQGALID